MKLNFKRLMAMLLSVMMVVSMLPTAVFATEATETLTESNYVAQVGDDQYTSLEGAFTAATETDTIVLLSDAAPALTSQKAITAASVIDLNGKTLTLTEDDLYFGTTTFKNGKIVVDPSVVSSTAVFWMFQGQTLTFDSVEIVATGVTGCYLIGTNGGTGANINLTNGSKIAIANTEQAALTAVIAGNSTNDQIVIDNSTINVSNIEGRVALGGSYTVSNSTITANGVKEGFYIRANQSLSIAGTSNVSIVLNSDEGRYGINISDASATYTKADTATVNASLYESVPAVTYVAEVDGTGYDTFEAALAVADGKTVKLLTDVSVTSATIETGVDITIDLNGKTLNLTPTIQGYGITVNGTLTIDGTGTVATAPSMMGVGFQVAESGKLTVNSGNFTFSGFGGNIASVSGEIVVNGGSFTGVASNTSIFNTGDNATVTITDGTFSHTPIAVREDDTRNISISGGYGYTDSFDENWLADGYALENGAVVQAAAKESSCSISTMYMEDNGTRIRVYGECNGVYAAESLVFKLYSGETLLATSSLNTTFPYETNELTVNIVLAGEPSGSWNNVLEAAVLSVDKMPTHADVYVDGTKMATVNVQMNGPDGKAKIVAAVVENGKITKLVANTDYSSDFTEALNTALANGGNIVLMRDVELSDTLTVPSGVTVTLDLNGKTISQSKECTESYSMIENNGSLTITGDGKISFTDTGAGDPTFGWGSYTIRNAGTLVVENGTVEHLGTQSFATHCIMAIFNYSGSTTINGGTISTPNYRSMRLWMGTMTINGGEIDGQVWVQTVSGEGATLNITGGSFCPNGNDVSSVYVQNDNNTVSFAVSGGNFETKIGCSNAGTLTGSKITGGTFSEAAVTAMGTNSALLGEGKTFTQNTDGTYGVAEAPAEESWYDAAATELIIDTPEELAEFAQIVNGTHATIAKDTFSGKTVKLGADIDLSGITWTPVASFAGTFDGNNYTISNFKLDSTNADAGFFAYIGKYPATAKNLTLANVEAIAGANELGILAATAHTTVVNNVTIKNVKVTTTNSNARVGGFFGYFNWTSAANSKLVNFEVDATMGAEFIGGYASYMDQNDDVGINNVDIEGFKVIVSDTDGNCEVGGFTGQTQTGWRDPLFQNCDVTGIDITATGTVTVGGFVANPGAHTRATNCTTEGKIDATGVTDPSNYIGGFFGNAGWNDDLGSQGGHKLTNCSADVDIITGGAAAGGFIGSATNDNNANMPIAFTECEAKGTITVADGATANIGGFAGEADRGTYTDCTAAQTPFIGGTPTNVEIESTSWYDAEATEFVIMTAEELAEFAQIVNGTHTTFGKDTFSGKTVKLGANIDLSGIENWTPIGNNTDFFWGTFDGDNYTISNMTIDMESTENVYAGLFGGVRKATIKNLIIKDASINAVGAKAYVGAVAGCAHSNSENHTTANLNFENIKVDGCTINATSTSGSVYVGGLVGYCYPANMTNISVSNLTLNPKATGSVFAGGLVGYMQGQNISNNGNTRAYYTVDTIALNNITVKSETNDSLIGGFAGYTYYGYITLKNATIDGFKVEANVTKEALVGGLIGLAHRSDKGNTFTNVKITGIDFDVVSDSGVDVILGGMVGYSGSPITYSDCSASGTITETTRNATSSAFVGGFVGQVASWSPSFTNCSADVAVEASSNSVGGFAGCVSTNSTYTNCSATTDPFIGYYYSGTLTNNGSYVASVGTVYYANFANAIAAANATEGGATVTLLADVTLSEMLTITGTVTLDLNGKTITGTDNTEKNFGLISVNKGNLTVNDSVGTGKITLTATVNSGWSRYSAVIANNQGTVTVTGGTIEHLGGTDMAYGIDNLTNGTIGDAALTVTGGTVKSTYRGIRMFANSDTCTNTLTITGGTVEGTNKGVWLQSANTKANIANLTINGTASVNSVYVWAPESGDASKLTMAANAANVNEVVDGLPEGYAIKNNDGVYGIGIVEVTYVAQIGDEKYASIQKAIDAAADNATITLLSDVKLETTTKTSGDLDVYLNVAGKPITLDMNGKTISVEHMSTTDRIYAVICVEDGASLTVTGNGTIDATVDATTPKLAYMFLKLGNGALTIENGTYHMNNSEDSMVYTNTTEVVTVNGGTWTLDAVGTRTNGFPCIFNAKGNNERNINVNGGTYNSDINHQYYAFEADVPETKALKNNGDGTWTVVDAVAYVGEVEGNYTHKVGYATIAEAIAAADEGETVTLVADITLAETIKIEKEITLDLNGKTITGTDNNTTGNFYLINNVGTLTVKDSVGNGKITLTATTDRDWNSSSVVIATNPGGKLVVESGTIEHLGGTDMAYALDNLTNGKGTYAETVINGGAIKSTYRAVRQFLNGEEAQNILTINGGTIEGANKSIFFHDPSTKANTGTLTVSESAVIKGDVYLFVTEGSTEWPVTVSIATAALADGSTVTSKNVPAKYVVKETSGTWGVDIAPSFGKVAQIGETFYGSLSEAITAANSGDTIVLLADIIEDVTISKNLTIDGTNKNYTGTIYVDKSVNANVVVTVKNVNFVDGTYYAIKTDNIKSITVENCTVTNYASWGFLYANKSTTTVVVKNVQVDNATYGFHWVYGTSATLENVTMTNVAYGIMVQNYASKTITLKNCSITGTNPIYIWERDNKTGVQTFKFEGANTVGTLSTSQYTNYILTAADATLTAPEGSTVTTTVESSMVKYADGAYKVVKAVAKIGNDFYETVADALKAADDGATIELIYAEGDAPIAMNGYVSGKTVTITGTAQVDWEKGFLFVGRTNDGTAAADATLIFENATLTTTQGGDHGIHVSGAEKDSATKANGTVKMIGSTINLSYLINKGNMTLDNSTLTVKSGFSIGGRPANETVSGEDATATISLTNGSKVVVNIHNGMGLGYEAIGVMNIDATSSFETTQSFLVTAKGTMNLAGAATVAGTLTNNGSIVLTDAAATLTSSECGNVTTNVDGYEVKYADGKYALTKVEEVELFNNFKTVARLGETLSLIFTVPYDAIAIGSQNDYSATIVMTLADGTTRTETINGADWAKNSSSQKWWIEFAGIAAKEMADSVSITIYKSVDGETVKFSETYTDSVMNFADRLLANSKNANEKTMAVDMLNYGAAAQIEFNYNTNSLATQLLTDEEKALATATVPSATNNRTQSESTYARGLRMVLESDLSMVFTFNNISDGMYVIATYTDHYGNAKTVRQDEYITYSNHKGFRVSGLAVADANQMVTCTLYSSTGEVLSVVTDSINSYCARAIAGADDDRLFESLLKFAQSAYNSLHD